MIPPGSGHVQCGSCAAAQGFVYRRSLRPHVGLGRISFRAGLAAFASVEILRGFDSRRLHSPCKRAISEIVRTGVANVTVVKASAPDPRSTRGSSSTRSRVRDDGASSAEVGDELRDDPLARLDGAVEVALEVDRRVLAGEVAVPSGRPSMPANDVYWPTFQNEYEPTRERLRRPVVDRARAVPTPPGQPGEDHAGRSASKNSAAWFAADPVPNVSP